MFIVYTTFAAVWGALCYKKREELLPIQYYLSSLVGFLVIEMVANWGYYRYLNAHGKGAASTVFLIVGGSISVSLSACICLTMFSCDIRCGPQRPLVFPASCGFVGS